MPRGSPGRMWCPETLRGLISCLLTGSKNKKRKESKADFLPSFTGKKTPKTNLYLSLEEAIKPKHNLFFFTKGKFIWTAAFDGIFSNRFVVCLGCQGCQDSSSPTGPVVAASVAEETGEREPLPYLTLRRMLLSGRKPVLSPPCSHGLPPCWSRRWIRQGDPSPAVTGGPAHPHATVPHARSVLSARTLQVPQAERLGCTIPNHVLPAGCCPVALKKSWRNPEEISQ